MSARTMVKLVGVGFVFLLMVAVEPRVVRALDPAVREAAVVLANSGIEALSAGRWADAIRDLERALPLAEATGDRTLIAGCHRALAKAHDGMEGYDAALRHYRAYLAVGLEEPLRRKEVEDRVAVIERMREAYVVIKVDALDAMLTIDGAEARLGEEPVRLALGRHTIRVTAPGFEPHEEEIALTGGQTLQLAIRMRPTSPVVQPSPAVVAPVGRTELPGLRQEEVGGGGGTAWPWITLGLGLAAGGVGTWLVLDGTSDLDAVNEAADTPWVMSEEEAKARVADGDRKRTMGFVTGGVGGALLVTSVILFITEAGSDEGERGVIAPALAPWLSAQMCGLSLAGSF